MLKLDTNTLEIEGVTIYSDHADPDQFWYHEGPVALARRNNVPQFTLTTYRPSSAEGGLEGGGFLTMEVNLKLDRELYRKIKSKLGSHAVGEPRLAPIPYDTGTVRLIALDKDSAVPGSGGSDSMVELIMGASKPALAGENNAVFSMKLSQEGAILLQSVFKQGGSHIAAIYDLTYTALRPSIEVNIHANFKHVYDHLSMGLDLGVRVPVKGVTIGLDADLDFAFEKLKQDGIIQIEVTNFSTENDRAEKENYALQLFKDMLKEKWFEATLVPVDLNDPTTTRAPGTTRSPGTTRNPGTTRAPGTTRSPGVPSPGIPSPGIPSPGTTVASTTRSPGTGTTTVAPGTTTAPVTTRAPGAPDSPARPAPVPGGAMRSTEGAWGAGLVVPMVSVIEATVGFKLKKVVQKEDKTLTISYHRSDAVKRMYAPQGIISILAGDLDNAHFIEVDLDDDFFRRFDVSVNTGLDFATVGLAAAEVAIDYGRETDASHIKHKEFRFVPGGETQGSASFFVNESLDLDYAVSSQYHFDPASEWVGEKFSYELPPRRSSDRTLLVNPYNELGFMAIRVMAGDMDGGLLSLTEVHLSYEDSGGWSTEKLLTVRPGDEAQQWRLRLSRADETDYSYRLVHHLKNGKIIEGETLSSDVPVLTVNDPFTDALEIEFFPNYDPMPVRQLFIDIHYHDEPNDYVRDTRLVFTGDMPTSQKVRFARLDGNRGTFSFQITVLGKDNSVKRIPGVSSEQTLVFIGEHLTS